VYDWFQTWTNDVFQAAHGNNGSLNTVLSSIGHYSIDAGGDYLGQLAAHLLGQQKYDVTFNPFAAPFRTNGDDLPICMQPRTGVLVNTLYHEGRHAYQASLATLANDEDQDGLVNVIQIAPTFFFQDSKDPRAVCNPLDPDVVQINWQFLGPGNFDAFGAPAANQQGLGHVDWALEMDAYVFAAAPPR
jgi:hypothetical protein